MAHALHLFTILHSSVSLTYKSHSLLYGTLFEVSSEFTKNIDTYIHLTLPFHICVCVFHNHPDYEVLHIISLFTTTYAERTGLPA